MVLNAFYASGIYFLGINWVGSFLLLAVFFSGFIAKDPGTEASYINENDLEEYNTCYYYEYNRLLLSLSYIYFGYESYHLITLDILFFLIMGYFHFLFWHITFFMPVSGDLPAVRSLLYTFTTLLRIVFSLAVLVWVYTTFEGVTWFSSIITTPFFITYDGISSLFI